MSLGGCLLCEWINSQTQLKGRKWQIFLSLAKLKNQQEYNVDFGRTRLLALANKAVNEYAPHVGGTRAAREMFTVTDRKRAAKALEKEFREAYKESYAASSKRKVVAPHMPATDFLPCKWCRKPHSQAQHHSHAVGEGKCRYFSLCGGRKHHQDQKMEMILEHMQQLAGKKMARKVAKKPVRKKTARKVAKKPVRKKTA